MTEPRGRRFRRRGGRLDRDDRAAQALERQEVLRSQLAGLRQLGAGPARILDAGCGQGTQALHLVYGRVRG